MESIKKKYHKPAFSLIEMLTVILVVAIGLVGATQLIAQNLNAQMINKGGIVAYQLAQEGLEIVRQIRDTNWLDGEDWRTDLDDENYCTDYRSPFVLTPVASLEECPLYLDENNWYVTNEGEDSGFNRIIVIEEIDENTIELKAIVTWDNRDRIITYEAVTHLYNWY